MNQKFLGYARLARPANLPTAAADILAGVVVSDFFFGSDQTGSSGLGSNNTLDVVRDSVFSGAESSFFSSHGDFLAAIPSADVLLLVLASIFLYAGGVILNDVFDYRVDKVERPERPIPSGVIPLKQAMLFGAAILVLGIVFAFLVHHLSGMIAIVLAITILIYDGIAKKHGFFGPLAMGICRGLNLILGMSVLCTLGFYPLAVVPIVYIFAITLISRGEVHGKNRNHIVLAGVLYAIVIFAVAFVAFRYTDGVLFPLLFLALFALLIFRPLFKAYRDNSPQNIKKAVIAGVVSLVVLDASIAAGFSVWWYGLLVLALLPLSMGLSKLFAVT